MPPSRNSRLVDLSATSTNISRYRLSAKTVFATWPRCDITPEDMLAKIRSLALPSAATLEEYVIAQEDHQDGGKHLHAYLTFSNKLETKNPRWLDVDGHHPNVQGCRSPKNVLTYVTKGGIYISSSPIAELEDQGQSWGEIIKNSSSVEDFLRRITASHPRDAVLHYSAVVSFAEAHFSKTVEEFSSSFANDSWIVPSAISEWVSGNLLVSLYPL